jgi:hypothetical protein
MGKTYKDQKGGRFNPRARTGINSATKAQRNSRARTNDRNTLTGKDMDAIGELPTRRVSKDGDRWNFD